MNVSEKAKRNAALIADRAKGHDWKRVAEKHDVSVRHAKRIWAEEKALRIPELREEDALDVVYEMLRRYEEWQNQLAVVTEVSEGAVKIGAIRAQMDCEARKAELRQATGLLPKHLGKLAVEWDVRFVVRQVVAVLEKHDASPEFQREMLAALKPGEN